jgi:hypothetical protein
MYQQVQVRKGEQRKLIWLDKRANLETSDNVVLLGSDDRWIVERKLPVVINRHDVITWLGDCA